MNDRFSTPDNDHQPIFWLRDYPVYAAYFVVLVFVVSLVATTLLLAANQQLFLAQLSFDSAGVLRGEVWRLFTTGLVNPPSLQFAFDMLMIAWFGRDLERFFGRGIFLVLCASLFLLPPLLFTAVAHWWPTHFAGEAIALAVFVAFASLYPNAELAFGIPAKLAAVILTGIFTLFGLAYHDWAGLVSLWSQVGLAIGFVAYQQGKFSLPNLAFWRRKPALRLLPDVEAGTHAGARGAKEDPMAEMDALLDKIARTGMASLTRKERAKLAKAREDLMQK
jgi:hypothetical protein